MMEVKLLRIVTGEEVIAEVVEENAAEVTVRNGLVVIPQANQMGFAPWAMAIDKDNPDLTISRTHIVYVAEVDPTIRDKYDQVYGAGIVKPSKKLILQ
tara:strand:+ start:529 stop:822 length:294 start_codon:yes stop_codon:yes gene_type:complete